MQIIATKIFVERFFMKMQQQVLFKTQNPFFSLVPKKNYGIFLDAKLPNTRNKQKYRSITIMVSPGDIKFAYAIFL